MSTHVDESVPSGPSESSEPSGSSEDAVDPGGPSAGTGSEWVRAEMLRRMAANRSTRGRHARRGEPPAPPAAEQPPRGAFPGGVRPARRRTDTPQPWAAPAPAASAADMPENYVPRHSVRTPGPAADPVEPGSGPILAIRPAGATADGARARDAGEPDGGVGRIGGPSLPSTGLPMRRRRGGGPGTPLQVDAAPVPEPWVRPGPVVPHEPARRLGAPPDMLGAAEPIPAWGLPLASPPRGFAMPALPETAAGAAPGTAPDRAAAEPVATVLDLEVAPVEDVVAPVADAPAGDAPAAGAVTGGTAVDDTAPEGVAPQDTAPADLAPADMASDDVASDETADVDAASDDMADVEVAADETAAEDAPVAAQVVERDVADGADGAAGTKGDDDPTPGPRPADGPTSADAPEAPDTAAGHGGPTGTAVPTPEAGPRGPQRPNGASPRNGASPKNGSHLANEAGPANGGVRVHAPAPALAHAAGADDVAVRPSGSVDVRVLPTAPTAAQAAAPGPAPVPAALPGETPEETTDEIAGGISDTPTAPHPIVVARRAALSGRAAGVPAQRTTVEPARALTPRPGASRNIPVVGTAPPEPGSTRVRVVLSERKGVARPVRTIKEVQEGTAVGELLRRDLIRSQLSVTTRFALLTVLVLGALPAVFALLPEVSRFQVLGVRLPWLLLGVLMYPFLVAVAWRYTRVADRVEQNFADHVQD